MNAINELRQLLGESAVLDSTALGERLAGIWRPDERLSGRALLRPSSTEGVSQALKWCHGRGLPVVTQGGLTGLVHGADTDPDCVVLSLERLNTIEFINPAQRIAQVQAGVTLQTLQEAVEEHGLMFPLDLGARGTATVGGNAATNAGGNRVIRYGMMRDMILGIEAVLADGTIINSLNGLIKNNAGYDVKQLFIGTEGTLGVITRLTLRLREAPVTRNMAFVACESFAQIKSLLRHMDRALGGSLSAFECLWQDYYRLVTSPPALNRPPVSGDHPYYVLLEAQGADASQDAERFNRALETALEGAMIADAAISQSEADCERFWAIRDDVHQVFNDGHPFVFDVSLPINEMERYIHDVKTALSDTAVQHVWTFGHLGDGNLHLAIQVPTTQAEQLRDVVDEAVYGPLAAFKGSVSAEHGIGLEKKRWLPVSRSADELALMRTLKRALDPKGILNPGKVFDTDV